MHAQVKFSIIVPVYNTEKSQLERLLDSICRQQEGAWEAILVDDGSTNDCGVYCDRFAEEHEHFRVIHKENGGVASARNRGVEEASGEWILFVDNDDWLAENAVGELLRKQELLDAADVLYFDSMQYRKGAEPKQYKTILSEEEKILTSDEVYNVLLDLISSGYHTRQNRLGYFAVWSRVFRRSFLLDHRIRFYEDMTIADDVMLNIDVLLRTRRAAYIPSPLYLRDLNPDSDSHRYHPEITENDAVFLGHLQNSLAGKTSKREIRESLMKRYVICVDGVAGYDMCHRRNPKKFGERLADLRAFTEKEPYRGAIKKVPLAWLPKRIRLHTLLLRLGLKRTYILFRLHS